MTDEKKAPFWAWQILVAVTIAIIITGFFLGNGCSKTLGNQQVQIQGPIYVYDFTKNKASTQLEVKFYKDDWVGVNIPPRGYRFRTDPDSDVNIVFPADKARFIDGPGKQVVYGKGINRTIFLVRGLEKGGLMKLTLEPI